MSGPLSMAKSEFNKISAVNLARLIASRKVSPVEAVAAALERVEQTEAQLNAFIQVDAAGARAAARRAEADVVSGNPLGPLHGVPISVKDLIDVQGCGQRTVLSRSRMRWRQLIHPLSTASGRPARLSSAKRRRPSSATADIPRASFTEIRGIRGIWSGHPAGRVAVRPLPSQLASLQSRSALTAAARLERHAR